jgi:hypothetical protein
MNRVLFALTIAAFAFGCKPEPIEPTPIPPEPMLKMKFKFDKDQPRLNNLGQPVGVAPGNAAQSPTFHRMAAHWAELTPSALTMLGDGFELFKATETTVGGGLAIDFEKTKRVKEGEVFFSMPLKNVQTGVFEYLRISLNYQEFDLNFRAQSFDFSGRLAGFLGYNQYITKYFLDGSTVNVNANKLQGYWAFKTLGQVIQGQIPPGGITVPNPIFNTSPVPAGSCIVTGAFDPPLVIYGDETKDIVITVSVSVNNSFEWTEVAPDGKYEPSIGETPVDMGVRGIIPYWEE